MTPALKLTKLKKDFPVGKSLFGPPRAVVHAVQPAHALPRRKQQQRVHPLPDLGRVPGVREPRPRRRGRDAQRLVQRRHARDLAREREETHDRGKERERGVVERPHREQRRACARRQPRAAGEGDGVGARE